jgi:hypothetical protein
MNGSAGGSRFFASSRRAAAESKSASSPCCLSSCDAVSVLISSVTIFRSFFSLKSFLLSLSLLVRNFSIVVLNSLFSRLCRCKIYSRRRCKIQTRTVGPCYLSASGRSLFVAIFFVDNHILAFHYIRLVSCLSCVFFLLLGLPHL